MLITLYYTLKIVYVYRQHDGRYGTDLRSRWRGGLAAPRPPFGPRRGAPHRSPRLRAPGNGRREMWHNYSQVSHLLLTLLRV